jgi:DNA ligase-associated metallophosphoesterase
MSDGDVRAEVKGEELVLLPERAVWWPSRNTLLVADVHFGKAASFRAHGVPVPHGTTVGTLARLDAMLERTGANRIIFIGDFLHAREGRAPDTVRTLAEWRRRRSAVSMTLVRGNHDRRAGDPLPEIAIDCVDPPLAEPPFTLAHHPRAVAGAYVIAGHLHPAVVMTGPARQWERLPCFWFGSDVAVLPAFGDFTGVAEINPLPADRVFVIAGELVLTAR